MTDRQRRIVNGLTKIEDRLDYLKQHEDERRVRRTLHRILRNTRPLRSKKRPLTGSTLTASRISTNTAITLWLGSLVLLVAISYFWNLLS